MHFRISWIFTITSFCIIFGAAIEDSNPIVSIVGLGKIKGSLAKSTWHKKAFYEFRGIKLAEPPTGSNRFKAPIKIKPWEGVMDASSPAKACADYNIIKNYTTEELVDIEDCISLSVYSRSVRIKNLAKNN